MSELPDIRPAEEAAIARAAAVLRAGGLVGFPTETVYGLGANALDARAVAGIFEAKGRPRFDPLIVHAADTTQARSLVTAWPEEAARLAGALWPGPLTLVLPRAPAVPDLVTAGLGTLAVRVPGHAAARRLIEAAGVPVAAPSANRFGSVSPTRAGHVAEELGERVPLILDGGPCRAGVESTVVSLMGEVPVVLRPGATPIESIRAVVGEVQRIEPRQSAGEAGDALAETSGGGAGAEAEGGDAAARASPGMLDRHYAPGTRLELVDDLTRADPGRWAGRRVGVLAWTADHGYRGEAEAVERLSDDGDLRAAAAGLFAAIRALDHRGLDVILAQRVTPGGLGEAINDRLTRASAR